ncbi:MAG: hypothetical protein DDT23_00362 [candidate division WS2 bacterium]|nr:hypothetical protein [Candidatus Lithacetigena glycinireducens]
MKVNIKVGGKTLSLEYKGHKEENRGEEEKIAFWEKTRYTVKNLVDKAVDKVNKVASIEIERTPPDPK